MSEERLLDTTREEPEEKKEGKTAGKGEVIAGVAEILAGGDFGVIATWDLAREGGGEVAPGVAKEGDLDTEQSWMALLFFTGDLLEEPLPPPLFLFWISFFLASLDSIVGEFVTGRAPTKYKNKKY